MTLQGSKSIQRASGITWAAGAFCMVVALTAARAQTVTQDFETWPETPAFGTYSHDGWVLSDGQVKPNRRLGFGTPIDTQSGWLNDADATSNTWIRSPLMPHGVASVTFNVRPGEESSWEQFYAVERSADGTNWVMVQDFDRLNSAWSIESAAVNVQTPVYVRIIKTADTGTNDFLGLDNIQVVPPPGVIMSDLTIAPTAPTVTTPVHVFVNALPGPASSNVLLSTYYRPGTAGVFSVIGMTNVSANTYRTQAAIPAGFNGTVQYYIHCTYDGPGDSPVFFPEGGAAGPAAFDTSNPYITTSLRQLNPSSRRTPLIISEIMYHPPAWGGTGNLQFVEIFNTEPVPNAIGGYRLAGDIAYTFPMDTVLEPREFMVVAADPAALAAYHGIGNVAGPFTGNLPNSGGQIVLRNREDALLLEVNYQDDAPWPVAADGFGHSLLLARPDYGEDSPLAWSASHQPDGTPGNADVPTASLLNQVVINEFLAHTDLPHVDYIELYNAGTQSVDISGCILSDNPNTNKFVIPAATVLPPYGFVVFQETTLGFALSSTGEQIILRAPDGKRVIDAVRFPAQRNGIAVGRYPDGAAGYHALAALTPGTANAATSLLIDNIVINEIMFNPISGDDDDEYIELYNRGTEPVDVGHWRISDGIRFDIPTGTVIPADGYLVIARDAQRLRARYPQLHAGNTLGNFSGRLSNRGERLVLSRPDDPSLPNQDFVTIDEVLYGDDESWGHWIDGGGSSLELIDPRSDNRLAMNWAGSDESEKADWTTLNYTGIADMGNGTPNQIRLYYLQGGECVVDDVVIKSATTTLLNDNFEAGGQGWQFYGNHSRSVITNGVGHGGSKGLILRGTGQGNQGTWSGWSEAFWNHAGVNLISQPTINGLVTMEARLRWRAGWPFLAMVNRGFWVEAPVRLNVPENLGTPGLPNSRYRAHHGPAIDDVRHHPVLPAAGEPIVVSAFLHDPDGIAGATLHYRIEPSLTVQTLPMRDDGTGGDALAGNGRWSASIPPQAAGARIGFFITANDGSATNRYPEPGLPGWPVRECLVRVGDPQPAGVLGTYRLWLSEPSISRWMNISGSLSKFSNEHIDHTFVAGDYRVIYNAGARWRGLWRGYNQPHDSGAYSVEFPLGERFLGDNEIKLDQIGQNGADTTRQQEGYCFWMARQIGVPAPAFRYVRVVANGVDRGILHDLMIPSRDLSSTWFGDDDPTVFKNTGWVGDPFELRIDGLGQYKQSLYRWNLQKKTTGVPDDDYSPAFALAQASATVDKTAYLARMSALLDRRNWTAFFAICGATAAWDHYGWSHAHNSYIHMPNHRGATIFIYDMDHVGGGLSLFPGGILPGKMYQQQHAPFRREYWTVLKELVDGPMTENVANARLDAWYNAFLANGANVTAPTGWKAFLASARNTISSQLAPFNVPFGITTNGGANITTTNLIVSLGGRAPLNVDSLQINGVRQRLTFTNETAWTTDIGLPPGTNALVLTAYDWRGAQVATGGITVTVNAVAPSPVDQVIISEIMYHPPTPLGEYLELYNRSPHTFDMRGWRLNGASLVFDGGSLIRPGQYAVLVENLTAYQQTYSNAEVVVAQFLGSLDNSGETLTLQHPDGVGGWIDINKVRYDNALPWPQEAAGGGQSLQLIDVNQDNNIPGNWGTTPNPEPVWHYVTIAGVVSNSHPTQITNATLHFYRDGAGTVQIDHVMLVTGLVAEAGVNLLTNGDFESPGMSPWVATGSHAGSFLSTTNPQSGTASLHLVASAAGNANANAVSQNRSLAGFQQKPVTLSFWYRESPQAGMLSVSMSQTTLGTSVDLTQPAQPLGDLRSPGGPSSMAESLPALPSIFINEIMPHNVGAWADGMGDFDPWIELYNAGTTAVDLAEFRLSNDLAQPGLWAFPTGAVIAAQGFLLVWADGEPAESTPTAPHTTFVLNPTNGVVVLSRAHNGNALVLDTLAYGDLGPDYSWGRYPDGDPDALLVFHTPTPGFANDPSSEDVLVVINEWMSKNDTTIQNPATGAFDDWFELYNPNNHPVNLGGYFLTDNLNNTTKFRVPGGYVMPAHGFLLVWADDGAVHNTGSGDLHVNFRLNNAGEAIGLYKPDGTLADSVVFGPMGGDVSYGSWPDGQPTLYTMAPPTPGAPNRVLLVNSLPPSSGAGFTMNWLTQSGLIYNVLGATNLVYPAWSILDTITAQTGFITFTHTNPPAPAAYYRLQQAP